MQGSASPRHTGKLRIRLADFQQSVIILHQLLQLGGARPIQAVQLQRAAVGVVVAMLGTGKLFAPCMNGRPWQVR